MLLTTIAVTGDRFRSFGPYVASVNGDGRVAFQAERMDGTQTVCVSDEEGPAEIALVGISRVTSHPDLNRAGDVSFYGEDDPGRAWVFVTSHGGVHAGAAGFHAIGPAGPTMNEGGVVAFRGERAEGLPGIHVIEDGAVRTIAERDDTFAGFLGLPLVEETGRVVFRAERRDGVHGIYRSGDRQSVVEPVVESDGELVAIAPFPCLAPDGGVAFVGTSADGHDRVFVARDGAVDPVDGGEAFETHRGCLVAGRTTIRIATPRGGSLGLFAGPDPDADRVLAIGDVFDGSTVGALAANPVSVDGAGHLAIIAALADGRGAVVRADLD